jgi:hypothetical protein
MRGMCQAWACWREGWVEWGCVWGEGGGCEVVCNGERGRLGVSGARRGEESHSDPNGARPHSLAHVVPRVLASRLRVQSGGSQGAWPHARPCKAAPDAGARVPDEVAKGGVHLRLEGGGLSTPAVPSINQSINR